MNDLPLPIINDLIMWGTLLMQIGVVLLLVLVLLPPKRTPRWLSNNALLLSFLLILGSAIGSFYYSELANFAPCDLCWYQRIFIIPQVFILGLALYRGEGKRLIPYVATLSIIGFLIAIYQSILPFLGNSYICELGEVSCTAEYVTGFGYIDIPIMSLSLFAAILLLYRLAHRAVLK